METTGVGKGLQEGSWWPWGVGVGAQLVERRLEGTMNMSGGVG